MTCEKISEINLRKHLYHSWKIEIKIEKTRTEMTKIELYKVLGFRRIKFSLAEYHGSITIFTVNSQLPVLKISTFETTCRQLYFG